jgi:hypothetical protein
MPSYCSSAAAKSRFYCTELLSGRGLPTDRVHARFVLKLPCHRLLLRYLAFFCAELLGLLLVFAKH